MGGGEDMLSSKVTFSFKPSEQVLIEISVNRAKQQFQDLTREMANIVISKVVQPICHLDGSEMRIISAALTVQGIQYYRQGLNRKSDDALSLAGQVHMARIQFHREWAKKLGDN